MTFRVGQDVVYVGGWESVWDYMLSFIYPFPGDQLKIGQVYKVAGFTDDGTMELVGIWSPANSHWVAGFIPSSFRPATKPKSEISFTTGADPSTDQFDNRRKVRKRVLL